MYFCPTCNYSFDISKSTNIIDNRKILDNPIEVFKRLKANKDLSNYKILFQKEELTEHKIYNKLSDTNKEDLEILFQDNMIGYIEFKCSNCNYRKSITETIKLYQMNVKSQYNIFRSIDDNKILAMNPIYSRTKDYNCKNIECITHKDPSIKEAVFFREKDTYELNYICTICYNSWTI